MELTQPLGPGMIASRDTIASPDTVGSPGRAGATRPGSSVSVYVDDWRQRARVGPVEGRWSHLLADSEEELHAFAERLGLRRAWYQGHGRHPHYDVTEPTRQVAVALGAVPVTWREMGRMLRSRRPPAAPGSGPTSDGPH